jgi:hypothetical protein
MKSIKFKLFAASIACIAKMSQCNWIVKSTNIYENSSCWLIKGSITDIVYALGVQVDEYTTNVDTWASTLSFANWVSTEPKREYYYG